MRTLTTAIHLSKTILALILCSLLSSCQQYPEIIPEHPNIILIQADDLGFDDLGINGNTLVETPGLDKLASESMQFSRFYVNPVCAPSRASLLTGRNFLRTGVSHVHGGKDFLALDETTIAEKLKEAGYKTGMWGKWHSGHSYGYYPWQRGFDEAYMAKLYKHKNSLGLLNGEEVNHNKWADEVITDYAWNFIENSNGQPFFTYLSFLTCHAPLFAPEEYTKKYSEKGLSQKLSTLYGMISHMDYHLGKFLQKVEDASLEKNTLILFMSDNGPAVLNADLTDADRKIRYHSKMNGHKGNIWDNGIKSALFVKWEGVIKPSICNQLADITDIFPTLTQMAGIETAHMSKPLDGASIAPILFNNPAPENPQKISYNYAHIAWQPTKQPWTPEGTYNEYNPIAEWEKKMMDVTKQAISICDGKYKLIQNAAKYEGTPLSEEQLILLDLENDPYEKQNVASKHPGVKNRLKNELFTWFESIKKEKNAFSTPIFAVGYPEQKNYIIPSKAPFNISDGLKNTFNHLGAWHKKGDFAQYRIDVLEEGEYSVKLNFNNKETFFTWKVSVAGQEYFLSSKKAKQKPMVLKEGEQVLRLTLLDDIDDKTFILNTIELIRQ